MWATRYPNQWTGTIDHSRVHVIPSDAMSLPAEANHTALKQRLQQHTD